MIMLQLNPTIDISTPLGDAEALFIIDYGVNVNTVWVGRLKGGVIKHFYSDDVRVYGNPMGDSGWDTDVLSEKKAMSAVDVINEYHEKN